MKNEQTDDKSDELPHNYKPTALEIGGIVIEPKLFIVIQKQHIVSYTKYEIIESLHKNHENKYKKKIKIELHHKNWYPHQSVIKTSIQY